MLQRKQLVAISLAVTTALGLFLSQAVEARKKQWTVTERQVQLQKETTAGEKANELTKKEADDIREDLAKIQTKIDKAKEKNGGKLSYKDEAKTEARLNDVSLKIQKFKLAKRVITK
jgi:hypothetical protein